MKIGGIPEGYELVRIGTPNVGETVVWSDGRPVAVIATFYSRNYVIIRKIEPVCVWQHGMFNDGWITEDGEYGGMWHQSKPEFLVDRHCWWSVGTKVVAMWFATPLKFRDDLPLAERIQQVGPSVEGKQ